MTNLSLAEKKKLLELLKQKEEWEKYNKFFTLFLDEGPFRRELYKKHMEFFSAGSKYRQRAFIAGNRVGKTEAGCYEMVCHLTGLYPKWWTGKKFKTAIQAWAVGKTTQVVKETLQTALVGLPGQEGTGMIPKYLIDEGKITKKNGVPDAIEALYVKHVSGGYSQLVLKSYDQKREAFQGTKKQVIMLDEEMQDAGIYEECITRTADVAGKEGIIYLTFTPLYGVSKVVEGFLPDGKYPENGIPPDAPYKKVVVAQWEDVPHISEEWKAEALASYAPHQKEARSKGIPCVGIGQVYPYPESQVVCDPFHIPAHWGRGYGLDVGIQKTAAVFGAVDPDTGTCYIYSEHYLGDAHPVIHAQAIMQRGDYLVGVIDPAADRRQLDGKNTLNLFLDAGLMLGKADNSIEAGILKVGQMFATGQLKIFSTCTNLLKEFRMYHRDEDFHIVRGQADHALDALRYFIMSGLHCLNTPPVEDDYIPTIMSRNDRNPVTGY